MDPDETISYDQEFFNSIPLVIRSDPDAFGKRLGNLLRHFGYSFEDSIDFYSTPYATSRNGGMFAETRSFVELPGNARFSVHGCINLWEVKVLSYYLLSRIFFESPKEFLKDISGFAKLELPAAAGKLRSHMCGLTMVDLRTGRGGPAWLAKCAKEDKETAVNQKIVQPVEATMLEENFKLTELAEALDDVPELEDGEEEDEKVLPDSDVDTRMVWCLAQVFKSHESLMIVAKRLETVEAERDLAIKELELMRTKLKLHEEKQTVLEDKVAELKDKVDGIHTHVRPIVGIIDQALNVVVGDGFRAILQSIRNRIMHALNGNNKVRFGKKPGQKKVKKEVKKAVKQEVKKEIVPAVRAVVRPSAVHPFKTTVSGPSKAKAASKKFMSVSKQLAAYTSKGKTIHKYKTASTAEEITKAITLPGISKPFRFAGGYKTTKSAIADPFYRIDAPWTGTTAFPSGRTLAASDMPFFAFRNPFRAMVFYDPNSALQQRTANYMFAQPNIAIGKINCGPAQNTLNGVVINSNQSYYIGTPYTVETSTYQPHGPNLFAASITGNPGDNGRYLWYDATCQVSLEIVCVNASGVGGNLFVNQWSTSGVTVGVFGTSVTMTTAGVYYAFTFNITVSGYYCLAFTTATSGTFNFRNNSGSQGIQGSTAEQWCHRSIKNLTTNLPSTDGIRVNAFAVLYTNTAAPDYRSGKWAAFQSPPTTMWMDWVGGGITGVASTEDSVEADISHGFYGFAKPSEPADFNTVKQYDISSGQISDCYYTLTETKQYLVFWAKVDAPASTAGTPNPQSGVFHIVHAIEYGTEDVWRQVQGPSIKRQVWEKGLDAVRDVPQFHQNETHIMSILKSIVGGIGKGAGYVAKYAPMIGDALSIFA